MKLILLAIAIPLIYLSTSHGYERSDAFIVRIFNDRVKVLSPSKYNKKLNVIIENKTINSVMGKVDKEYDDFTEYVTIDPGKHQSVVLKYEKGEKVFFTPLSPPFQKVVLKLGTKSYEIPPKE